VNQDSVHRIAVRSFKGQHMSGVRRQRRAIHSQPSVRRRRFGFTLKMRGRIFADKDGFPDQEGSSRQGERFRLSISEKLHHELGFRPDAYSPFALALSAKEMIALEKLVGDQTPEGLMLGSRIRGCMIIVTFDLGSNLDGVVMYEQSIPFCFVHSAR